MADWRNALAIIQLRNQLNQHSPHRDKGADGTIGNAEHASRSSDHNPHVKFKGRPVVTAIDITHDPAHGVDGRRLAEALVATRDERIKYIISNGEIISGPAGPKPWVWRKYTGKNPHRHHMHLSVRPEHKYFDSTARWDLDAWAREMGPAAAELPTVPRTHQTIALNAKGASVEELQKLLNGRGHKVVEDGHFGPNTDKAVRAFQKKRGIFVDGVVGPHTWEELNKAA